MGALAVRVITNRQIDQGRAEARQAAEARQTEAPLTGLTHHIERFWQAAQQAKRPIEIKMLQALRQRLGVYEPTELAQIIEQGGSAIYMMLTQGKCRGAEAWLREILCNEIDKPWGLGPTPLSDLPPNVSQAVVTAVAQQALAAGWEVDDARVDDLLLTVKAAAAKRVKELAQQLAERHELVITDQFAEGGWEQALSDFIYNLITYPAAFIKGPIKRMALARQWQQGEGGWEAKVSRVIRPEWECRSPWDIFPAPAMMVLQRGNLIDRYRFRREDLQQMLGVDGYDSDAIDAVIEAYGARGYNSRQMSDTERSTLELRHYEQQDPEGNIEALNFWGSASGHMMLDWGYESGVDVEETVNEKIDPKREYQIEAWRIGRWTIKAQINPDPLRRKPYTKCSFEEIAGSFWGQGLPEIIRDCQGMCNGAARALANNAAIACLTGDTIVYRNQRDRRGRAEVTLDEMWAAKHRPNSGLRRMKLRSLDMKTGQFIYNRVVDIVDNGVRPVFEILTENGYRIKATDNHRFLDELGEWRFVRDFHAGMKIGVNGSVVPLPKTCADCGKPVAKATSTRCRPCAALYMRTAGAEKLAAHVQSHNLRQMAQAAENRDALATTARARKACRDALQAACERCGDDVRLHVHHKDRDPWNNDRGNLETLCEPCHKYEHKRHDGLGNPYRHKYLDFDPIISIRSAGEQRVFDLVMTAPNHWFVANGLLSHNSGPQVDLNVDLLADGEEVTKPYPWRVYQTISHRSGNNVPAVRFWQANMNVQELLGIYQAFERIADNVSGIPAYSYGDSKIGGAGRTSSGLAQMMSNSARGVRRLTSAVDRTTIKPHVEGAYDFNMEFHPDPTIKGDLRAVAKGSAAVLMKSEVALRQREMLAATLNPLDAQIIGPEGRAAMLRPALKNADFDVEDILPDALQLALRTAGMEPAAILGKTGPNAPASPGMGGTGGTPAGSENVDLAGAKPNGVAQREQNQGFADGGVVRRPDHPDYGV